MTAFYKLNNSKSLLKSLYYSFNFNGYINSITNIQKLLANNTINYCSYINNDTKDKTNFCKSFNCSLLKDNLKNNIIKNTYTLDNNLILTGPNAAGKTTLLKSTLINLILSQQFGCGFYNSAQVKIYDYFHCYINIPETSNRDSLFQAEARQCKDILDIIKNNPDKNHFCVFDELYSGTNPDEATNAAIKLLNYISTNNVNFILTTHYTKICKKINKKHSKNHYMYIDKDTSGNLIYTYKLKSGISKIKGAFNVLEKLNYPKEMLE